MPYNLEENSPFFTTDLFNFRRKIELRVHAVSWPNALVSNIKRSVQLMEARAHIDEWRCYVHTVNGIMSKKFRSYPKIETQSCTILPDTWWYPNWHLMISYLTPDALNSPIPLQHQGVQIKRFFSHFNGTLIGILSWSLSRAVRQGNRMSCISNQRTVSVDFMPLLYNAPNSKLLLT